VSLKWFHVVFIGLSVVVAVGFGVWALTHQYAVLGRLSLAVAALLAVYARYFLQKARKLGLV
jgi:hypothetical protein